jgi:hypothetical protein
VNSQDQEYAGFWIRVGASLIDTILVLIIISPFHKLAGTVVLRSNQIEPVKFELLIRNHCE